jgi:hypothetical protein
VDWLTGGPPRHLFNVGYQTRTRQRWTAKAKVLDISGDGASRHVPDVPERRR